MKDLDYSLWSRACFSGDGGEGSGEGEGTAAASTAALATGDDTAGPTSTTTGPTATTTGGPTGPTPGSDPEGKGEGRGSNAPETGDPSPSFAEFGGPSPLGVSVPTEGIGAPVVGEAEGRSHATPGFNRGASFAEGLASVLGSLVFGGAFGKGLQGEANNIGPGSLVGTLAGGPVGAISTALGLGNFASNLSGNPVGSIPGGQPTANDPSPSLGSIPGGGPTAPGTPSTGPGTPGGTALGDTPSLSVADNSGTTNAGNAIASASGVTGGGGAGAPGSGAPSSISGGSSFNDMIRRNMMLQMLSQGRVNT